ncbi:RHS repeat domain-containing protein [Cytobacillus horneckiae]|uniref:RHS repeat domain-containing protein n=1 Tax=Cytobacillus horneckiae TaxID=549687 RepID=UPI003D9A7EEF
MVLFYRNSSGQHLSFEYKQKSYDYVYNQRGDIVAITDAQQNVIAKYTYDEWGSILKSEGLTDIGKEVVKANPFRYVGKFGVQYDEDTRLYFMGWREYDPKIGRFLVADEYEGEDDNPISFNRYLYAESDPVNNIDPDGYAPKWLKKLSKGVKKAAKATYNFAIGDDIKTIKSKKTKWYQKAGAAISIASNFIPGGGLASKAVKAAIKGTSKAYKAAKATKKATTKIKRSPSKKVSSKVNKKQKTVAAKPIRTAPKVQSKANVKVAATTVKSKKTTKTSVAPKPKRNTVVLRVEKTKVIKASKDVPKGGSSTAGKSPSSAKKSSSSNKQIMEDDVGDKGGGKLDPKITELHQKLDALAEEHLLPEFRKIDPNLEAGYTGSFKTGTVGNPNKTTYGQPIDLNNYDIDYYIKSDKLYDMYGNSIKANPKFREILSQTPGFEGLKPNKGGFSIKFLPSN